MDGCGQGGHSDISCVLWAIGGADAACALCSAPHRRLKGPGYDGRRPVS
ncbi:hypothetical protein BQ8420_23280 [Nocardiopsis sp. JB363]|nr:hypothetical protein BQ8420_23280 [Nocardiopsis sp. JB363]